MKRLLPSSRASENSTVSNQDKVSNQDEITEDALEARLRHRSITEDGIEGRLKPYFAELGDRIEAALKRELEHRDFRYGSKDSGLGLLPRKSTIHDQHDLDHDQDSPCMQAHTTHGKTKKLWGAVGTSYFDKEKGWVRKNTSVEEKQRNRRRSMMMPTTPNEVSGRSESLHSLNSSVSASSPKKLRPTSPHVASPIREDSWPFEELPEIPPDSLRMYKFLVEDTDEGDNDVRDLKKAHFDFARSHSHIANLHELEALDPGNWSQQVVSSPNFEVASGCAILLNALLLGVETDYAARHWRNREYWLFPYLTAFMCVLFTLEVVMRMRCKGIYAYFTDAASSRLNCFEGFLACIQWSIVINNFAAAYGHDVPNDHGFFQCLKLARMFSILRLLRIMGSVHHVRLLVNTIAGSMTSFMTLILVLVLSTFLFGAVLTSVVTNHVKTNPEDESAREELQEFFGSLTKSMLALYESATDGVHWRDVMEPLVKHCSPWLRVAFVLYSTFIILALMNILTGFFLESAMRIARDEQRDVVVERMAVIFRRNDVDKSGTISENEFETLLEGDDNLQFLLTTMDIRPEHAMQLFSLLDEDGSGEIELNEFLIGVERLQGSAKAIDFAAFRMEWQTFVEKTDSIHRRLFPDKAA